MILITGATGKLGAAVIQHLLMRTTASQIAALARDEGKASALREQGVNVRAGHYDDAASLDRAMQGIEKVLLIAGTDEEKRLQQHQNVLDAAKKAGVRWAAYTSRTLRDRATLVNQLMRGHFQTEDYLQGSGLDHAIFRNVLYMDTLPQFVGPKVFETGIHLSVGQGKVPFALRSEMGEAIANALLADSGGSRVYHLTGGEAATFGDVAAALTELSGKEVKYHPEEKSAFEAQLKGRGIPEAVAQRMAGFMTDVENGQEADVYPDLENLLGRRPASLKEGLKTLFKL